MGSQFNIELFGLEITDSNPCWHSPRKKKINHLIFKNNLLIIFREISFDIIPFYFSLYSKIEK